MDGTAQQTCARSERTPEEDDAPDATRGQQQSVPARTVPWQACTSPAAAEAAPENTSSSRRQKARRTITTEADYQLQGRRRNSGSWPWMRLASPTPPLGLPAGLDALAGPRAPTWVAMGQPLDSSAVV